MVSNVSVSAQDATLETIMGAKLLRAAKAEAKLSDHDILIKHRCAMIEKHMSLTSSILDKATEYSCTAPVVGVAFYAGKDLGHHSPQKVSSYILDTFNHHGIEAKIYTKLNHSYGSQVVFLMRGGRYMLNPVDPLKGISSIEGFAAEAKLVALKDGIISTAELEKWVKSNVAYIPKSS